MRRIAISKIVGLHPALAAALARIDMHYLVPDSVFTRGALLALLTHDPIPVAKIGGRWCALAHSRPLSVARTCFDPSIKIPVLDCTALDSEALEAAIWSRLALHHLYTALHPGAHAIVADALRAAIPEHLAETWHPMIASRRQFSRVTGVARNTLWGSHSKRSAEVKADATTPLERIRKRVRHE